MDYTITPFDLSTALDAAYDELCTHQELIRYERDPEGAPLVPDVFRTFNRNFPVYLRVLRAVARDADGALVGDAFMMIDQSGSNAHAAQAWVAVRATHRRRGLGRALLGWVVAQARAHQRTLLLPMSYASVPAGASFLERMGAMRGLENRVSRLDLAQIDRTLLDSWITRAQERASGFELLAWENGYPDEQITAFAALSEVMNSAPHDALDLEDQPMTPERLREALHGRMACGAQLSTLVARERSSGVLAGFSELWYNPARPRLADQGGTAVDPRYRGLGLGRWIKAAMLVRVLHERPTVRYIFTDNAESNAPMLAINIALGFKPYMATTLWQIATERAAAFAASR